MRKLVFVFAIEEEAESFIKDFHFKLKGHRTGVKHYVANTIFNDALYESHLLITGFGGENVESAMNKFLKELKPCAVINIGTVGTNYYDVGSVLTPNRFYRYHNDEIQYIDDFNKTRVSGVKLITSDVFVEGELTKEPYIVDMEGYYFLKVCYDKNYIPYIIKVVSDKEDSNEFRKNVSQVMSRNKFLIKGLIEEFVGGLV